MDLETRNLWSQCPTIKILDGLLVGEKENHPVQLVVRECLRKQLFPMAYAGPLTAGRRTSRPGLLLARDEKGNLQLVSAMS